MNLRRREKRPDISVKKNNYSKQCASPVYPVCLAAGVFSLLFFLDDLSGIKYNTAAVYSFSLLFSVLMWYLYSKRTRIFRVAMPIFAAAFALLAYLFRLELAAEITEAVNYFESSSSVPNTDMTLLILFVSAAASILIFILEIVLQSHMLIYAAVTALTFLSPIIGSRLTLPKLLLAVLFQILFWVIHVSDKRPRQLHTSPQAKRKITQKSFLFTLLSVVLLFALLTPIMSVFGESIYSCVYGAEETIYKTVLEATGSASGHVTGGDISTSNNYRTGTVQLTVTTDKKPTETLYLRGFGGGVYIGNSWIRSSDEGIFDIMADELLENDTFVSYYFGMSAEEFEAYRSSIGLTDVISIISSIYYSLYYYMNSIAYTLDGDTEPSILVNVRHANGVYDNYYVPYHSTFGNSSNTSYSVSEGYVFTYYEQSDMIIDWDNMIWKSEYQGNDDIKGLIEVYRTIEEVYMNVIESSYTTVPTSILPKLTSFVEENPLTSLDEITSFILYTLSSRATYTLTPGWFPINEDAVEYFLFEGGEGYCQHFACAATLMYRLYGIPARYATGYCISPDNFYETDNGLWQADVTDESAHAWVEIFLSDYGWTRVEVTPASTGSMTTSYPGYDMSDFMSILTSEGWASDGELSYSTSTSISSDIFSIDSIFSLDFDSLKDAISSYFDDIFGILALCGMYFVMLVPFFIAYRRWRLMQKLQSSPCRVIFARYLDMIHFCGILEDCDGTETDFLERLKEAIPDIDPNLINSMIESVTAAAYGPSGADIDTSVMLKVYRETSKSLYERLNLKKRLVFCYIGCWG